MATAIIKALGEEAVGLGVLKALADNSFDSVLITDTTKAGKIIYANKAFKTLTGYEPASVIGKTPRILQGPKTDRAILDKLVRKLKEGQAFFGQAIKITFFSHPL